MIFVDPAREFPHKRIRLVGFGRRPFFRRVATCVPRSRGQHHSSAEDFNIPRDGRAAVPRWVIARPVPRSRLGLPRPASAPLLPSPGTSAARLIQQPPRSDLTSGGRWPFPQRRDYNRLPCALHDHLISSCSGCGTANLSRVCCRSSMNASHSSSVIMRCLWESPSTGRSSAVAHQRPRKASR
jgi:hypothetical protein